MSRRATWYWQFILLPLAGVFLFPLLWMFSTALKPVDQAMRMPPTWIPKAYYAPVDGVRTRVVPRETNAAAGVIVATAGDQRLFAPAADFDGGRMRSVRTVRGAVVTNVIAARLLKEVPPGFIYVLEDVDQTSMTAQRRWDYVAPAMLEARTELAWRNFAAAMRAIPFARYTLNTLILCLLCVIGTTLSNSLIAYGFARVNWPGRDFYFALTLATMMVPFPVTMIALYAVFKELHWVGTWYPLWVPTFFGGAFNIFLLRQFYLTIPLDLTDAARMDGCSDWQIYWRVIVPLSKPALAVVALFQFMGTWNDFMGPLLYLNDQKKFTLALGLQFFQSQSGGTEWHLLMAASTLMLLPILVLFFFTQKQFIQGIATTGMKG
jgi:multiple sugar transport system permease protein